jgi:hypothetical protein
MNHSMQRVFSTIWRIRRGMERRLTQRPAEVFWKRGQTVPMETAHQLIRTNIDSGRPFCAGRVGGEEQTIVVWGMKIPKIGKYGLRIPASFSDTHLGATNAGVRPRTKKSYEAFASLAFNSLKQVDLLAVWHTPLEYAILSKVVPNPVICDVEELSPTMRNEDHWIDSLCDKRILVVSPFKSSIEMQVPKLNEVWKTRSWKWRADFEVVKFPYLIDDDVPQTWQQVWDAMLLIVKKAHYDVALFGCGGLGMPLAAAAKTAGRIGIHMGGHLQLLFGIYGKRHLEQFWHARCINEAWVRPKTEEKAKTANRVKNGAYW